jgi:beta-glucanase (GH16 family)
MKKLLPYLAALSSLFLCLQLQAQTPTLVWSDDFSGSSLDLTKWQPQIGDGCAEGICGWGNGELQFYKAENAVVSGGMLQIIAKRERVQSKAYTSARIRTRNLADFTYGRMEARIKLPGGDGLWPAFWMLSTDEPYGGWPQSGEIDIMEFVSAKPDHVFGTIHYGPLYPNNQFQGKDFYLYDGTNFTDDFHEYAIEWSPNEIRWYVDNILYSVKTPADIAPFNWPFDHNFHFILNTAVGGTLGGTVDNSIFPATMFVDYVRVYNGPKPTISGERVVDNQAQSKTYTIANIANNVNVNWTVPSGASIVSGQGTNTVTVNFGGTSGNVTATFNAGSGTQSLPIYVLVEPPYTKGFTFVNFDEPGNATFASSNGTLTQVANPAPNSVNSSAQSGRYVRNSSSQYDVLFYNTSAISDASQYSSVGADKKFYMDLYTSAPIGTQIIVQLETSTATATNYPTGRHSRYVATITQNGSWHRLAFSFLDRPDGGASNGISKIAILFNSDSFTGDTYYFDNFDSYNAGSGGTPNQPPTVSITSPSNNSSFTEGTAITVAASASDADGSVSQVQFFANGVSIGIDNSAPYSVNWTVPLGTHTLTAVATDNQGASTTSAPVTVTGTSDGGGGTATALYVSSVVTGTVNIGSGNKRGTATVTILNDLNDPVSGAVVSGTFSGTFNESASGTTNSNGQVTMQTNGFAKGSLIVDFCVNNVNGPLPYDPSLNSGAFECSAGRPGLGIQLEGPPVSAHQLMVFPNPATDQLWIQAVGFEEVPLLITITDLSGRTLIRTQYIDAAIDVSALLPGFYLLEASDGKRSLQQKFVK